MVEATEPGLFESVEEAHRRTGIPERTLRWWIHSKQVPHYRVGHRVFLRQNELDAHLRAGRVEAV